MMQVSKPTFSPPTSISVGETNRASPVITRIFLRLASPDDAAAVGHDEGLRRAAPYRAAPSSLEALVSDLDRLGFDPVVSDAADDAAVVAFANCPFGGLAEQHPDLVCSLHRGLIAGFVAGMGDAELVEFCSVADRTPCQATLR